MSTTQPVKTTKTKAIVGGIIAIVGAGLTAAIGLVSVGSLWFIPLTVASAMVSAAGVYVGVYASTNRPV